MDWILLYEKRLVYGYYVFLILFNLVTISLILGILFSGQLHSCPFAEILKIDSGRRLLYLLFVNGMSNMLFVSISLIARIYS